MENDAVVRFLLGAGVAAAALMVSWIVFRIGRGKEALALEEQVRTIPMEPYLSTKDLEVDSVYEIPGKPTELKPVLEFTLIAKSARLAELDPPRERREFRFRGYDHFRDEEVYTWYRRNAQTGEVIGSVTIPVRVFWNRCYDG